MLFPATLHYHVEHQVWAERLEDGLVRVGITALGIALSGEIFMCRPKSVGQPVQRGQSLAVVELAKSIVSVKSPLSGTVVAVNPDLASTPEWVHEDCYGRGWLAVLQPHDWAVDAAELCAGDRVWPAMQAHARLFQIELPAQQP